MTAYLATIGLCVVIGVIAEGIWQEIQAGSWRGIWQEWRARR